MKPCSKQATMQVTPELFAIGATLISLAATPQVEVDMFYLWQATLDAVANNWQAMLTIVRSLVTGLVSSYVMGANIKDIVYGSPLLSLMTYLTVCFTSFVFLAASHAAKQEKTRHFTS